MERVLLIGLLLFFSGVTAKDGWWNQKIAPGGTPKGKTTHAAAVVAGDMYLVGGDPPTGFVYPVAQKYNLEVNQWYTLSQARLPQNLIASDMDSVGGMLVLFGGMGFTGMINDIYIIHATNMTTNWVSIDSDDSIPPRNGHTTTALGGQMYVFGGWDATQYFGDLWWFDTSVLYQGGRFTQWYQSSAAGPSPRDGHSMVAYGGMLVLFGGFYHNVSSGSYVDCSKPTDGCAWYNDLWTYTVATNKWTKLSISGAPSPRQGHSAVVIGDRMIIFGGQNSKQQTLNDLYSYSLSRRVWTKLEPSGVSPMPRMSQSAAVVGSTMLVYGGAVYNGGPGLTDLWTFTLNVEQRYDDNGDVDLYGVTGAAVFNIVLTTLVATIAYLTYRRLKGGNISDSDLHKSINPSDD
jgi:hypothetical protein